MNKMYAQINAEGICFCVGSPITDVEATYDCLGKRYVDGAWVDIDKAEIAEEAEEFVETEDVLPVETISIKYCPICNEEVNDTDSTCVSCGYDLTQINEA